MSTRRPIIGITPDVTQPRPGRVQIEVGIAYAAAVRDAGGMPIVLSPLEELIPEQLAMCDGFVLTGGGDARTEAFGEPTHAKATPVHEVRQRYETALLEALYQRPEVPLLGVCLGMQMMALVGGGRLDQHLPETLESHSQHADGAKHRVRSVGASGIAADISDGEVTSQHRQAVVAPGRLRVVAESDDGVIEAVELPGAEFFVGVQWHPERTEDKRLGAGLFEGLVAAARVRAGKTSGSGSQKIRA